MAMLLPFLNSTAQHSDSFACAFDTLLYQHKQEDPRLQRKFNAIDYGVKRFREQNPNLAFYPKPQPAPPCSICMTIDPNCFKSRYALPVIVHIVAKPGDTAVGQGSNIPDAQVYNALASLNRQFVGYGITDSIAVNTGIQFYLAPVGADSSGIFRYNDTLSISGIYSFAPLRNLVDSQYNTNQYIHIFVVDSITMQGIVGYASYTGGFNQLVTVTRKRFGNALDYCDSCDLSSDSRNKTLAHEMGHFLGLYHTFQDGCAGADSSDCATKGDRCCDTPPVAVANFGCPSVLPNSCSETPDLPDQIENFMDYTSEACSKWFTRNQAERMYYNLEYERPELISLQQLIAHKPDICLFSARFRVENPVVCDTGGTVTLKAIPYSTAGVEYRWTVFDSTHTAILDTLITDTAGTGTLSVVEVYFSIKGKYDVRLQVVYGNDTATEHISKAIWVTDCAAPIAHEGGNWFFGSYAGLVFTEAGVRPSLEASNPVFGLPTINTQEGSISLSTEEGELMFYGGGLWDNTHSGRLYNKNHDFINNPPASYPLSISGTAAQNSIAFPCPFDTGKIMLMQNSARLAGTGNLSYTLLKKDSTTGVYVLDTATRNTPVFIPQLTDSAGTPVVIREYLTAAPKCNARGYWLAVVIVHNSLMSNTLAILSVDSNGIHLADTFFLHETFPDPLFPHSGRLYFVVGQAKFSPDATKLAVFNRVFDFDRRDGTVTESVVLPFSDFYQDFYGVSFSPSSRYYYWIDEDYYHLKRIDLSRSNPSEHIQTFPPHDYSLGQMQLAPDGKIYIAMENSSEISVIHHPDQDGEDIGYEPYGVPLRIGGTGGTSQYGLPNFVDALRPELVKDTLYYTISDCNKVAFSTTACCYADYLWIFGDGDTSQQKQVSHTYSEYGVYEVKLVLNHSDTLRVTLPLHPPVVNILGSDTICSFNLQTPPYQAAGEFTPEAVYHWSLDSGTVTPVPDMPYIAYLEIHSVPALLKVQVDDPRTGCSASDSLWVTFSYGIDSNIINNGIGFLAFNPLDSATFSMAGSLPTGGEGSFSYQWLISYDSLTFEPISGQTGKDLTGVAADTLVHIRRIVSTDFCQNTSSTVKVYLPLTGNTIDDTLYFCYADSFLTTGSTPAGGIGGYQYQWYISDDDSVWNAIEDETDKDLYHTGYTAGRYFKRRVVSGSDTLESNTLSGIPKIQDNIINNGADTLIVYDPITSGMLEIAGNETEGTGSVSYQWYYSADSIDWHEVTGQDQMDLEHDTFSGYRWFYRVAGIDDCELPSNIVKVYPKVWNNVIGDTSVYHYCSDDSIQLNGTYPAGGIEAYTYQWLVSDNGSVWTDLAGQTEQNLDMAGGYPAITYFKRRAYSGLDSTESNIVQFIHTIRNNTLTSHYSDYLIYYCPGTGNTATNTGSTPTVFDDSPAYQWYISADSSSFTPIAGQTGKDLSMSAPDTIFFVYREITGGGCVSKSAVVKYIPNFEKNVIYADPCYAGIGNLNLAGNYTPFIMSPYSAYYYTFSYGIEYISWRLSTSVFYSDFQNDTLWQASDSTLAKSAVYTSPIDSFLYIQRELKEQSTGGDCVYTSTAIKVYNPSYLNQIEVNQSDSIAGKIPLPEGSYIALWQQSCYGQDWSTVQGVDENTFDNTANFECCDVRRLLVPTDREGNPLACDTFYSNVLMIEGGGYITQQPVTQHVRVGKDAFFSVSHISVPPFDVRWQQYNPNTSSWDNMDGETDTVLTVRANKCNGGEQFRAVLTNDCRTLYTDVAELVLDTSHSRFFLWLKDLPSDTAREPNIEVSAKNNYFGSPDIAASNTTTVVNGRLTMITVLDRELDLYVTVRNKGTDTSGGGELYLYASLNGLNPEWNFSFTDTLMAVVRNTLPVKNYFVPGTLPYLPTEGTPVNSEGIPIPDIPPGDSVRIHYRWTNPPEHFVQNYFSRSGSVYPTSNAVIYLARITECSSYPFEMSYPEVIFSSTSVQGTAKVNIKQNAKVAALHCYTLPVHNDAVSPFNSSQMQPDIITMVSSKMVLPVNLGVNLDSANAFFDNAEMYVFFDDVLWGAFVAGGNIGGGYTVVEDGVFRVSNYGAVFWSNMFLDTGVEGHAGFSFYYKTGEDTSGALINNKFRVFLTEDSQEQGSLSLYVDSKLKGINGGQTMMIPAQPRDAADKRIAGTQSHAKESAIASPLPPQERDPTTDEFMFSFRPNPFSRELFVRVSNAEPAAVISLSDMNGKVVYEYVLSGENRAPYYEFSIPAQAFAEGVYLLSYQSPTRKVVKKAVLLR